MVQKLSALNYYGYCTINAGIKVIKPLYSFVLTMSVAYKFTTTDIPKTKQKFYTSTEITLLRHNCSSVYYN